MRFLLDTNVISHIGKPGADRNLRQWLKSVDEEQIRISVITVRELRYGSEKARVERHAAALPIDARVSAILGAYAGRILPIDAEIAVAWAGMLARSNKHVDDTGLAATAAVHGLVVVTRNTDHLRGRGVPLLDPFRSPAALIGPAT